MVPISKMTAKNMLAPRVAALFPPNTSTLSSLSSAVPVMVSMMDGGFLYKSSAIVAPSGDSDLALICFSCITTLLSGPQQTYVA